MLSILGTLLTGILSGGATGLLGVLLQRYFDLQHKKQEIEIVRLNLANSIELAKMESERAQIRAHADVELADRDLSARVVEADAKAMQAAFDADKATYTEKGYTLRPGWAPVVVGFLMGLVDFLRGIVRPGMTLYLCVLVTYMFVWVKDLATVYGVKMTPDQVLELMTHIIATILYVFSVCTLFWFGTRPPKSS